jgi:hypothetical protein
LSSGEAAAGCALDLAGVLAGVVVPEVSLGALEVVVGTLPLRPFALVGRGCSECVAGVGDGVVEAVVLDARGRLLPGAPSARLVRERAERLREVGSWSLQRDGQMLAAKAREPRVDLGSALAERAALGVPCRAVGQPVRKVALALGGRRDFPLGELEALALPPAFGGVHGTPPQHTPRGLLELGDACPRVVSHASRLGPGEAGGVQLVDEVLGVLPDALAQLRELGLQLNDGRLRRPGKQRTERRC